MAIAEIVRSQLLSVLLDAVRSAPSIAPGQALDARLIALDFSGAAILQIGGRQTSAIVDMSEAQATPGQPMPAPGDMLRLRSGPPAQPPVFTLLDRLPQPLGAPVPALPAPALPMRPPTAAAQADGRLPGAGPPGSFQAVLSQTRADAPMPALAGKAPAPLVATGSAPVDRATAAQERAAARQAGMAPLFADVAAIARRIGPEFPPAVVLAAASLLGARLDARTIVTPEALRAAVKSVDPVALPPARATPMPNTAGQAQAGQASAAQATANVRTTPTAAPDRPVPSGELGLAHALTNLRAAALTVPGAEARPNTLALTPPPPPRRDGGPLPQPAAAGSLRGSMTLAEAASVVASQAEGALERLKLFQLASQPTQNPTASSPAAPERVAVEAVERTSLQFELPIALPRQTAIAHVQVERDAPQRAFERRQQWRLRFSVESEPTGALHASVGLSGRSISVSIWAEQAEIAAALARHETELATALIGAGLEIADLRLMHGAPPRATADGSAFGYFLDRAS